MAAPHPTEARFPELAPARGGYESFYLKLCHPSEPRGAWIRYTVHKRPGARPSGSLWFTLFDATAGGPRASKVTHADPETGAGDWVRIGEASLGPGRAAGSAPSEACAASWELRFESDEPPLFHLPRHWMYGGPLPRTKLLSPAPAAAFHGRLEVDGEEIDAEGWRGMVGHNWGAQHAERWIWLHALGLEGDGAGDGGRPAWLDAAIGRIKLGPVTTPWIANGALSLAGERRPLGGIERTRATTVHETPERCDFVLPGRGVRVRGSVSAPRDRFVGWVYADPDGSEHHTVNCSIADMSLVLERDGAAPVELSVSGSAAYELGMREQDHGMPIQPFPDG